MLRKLGNKAMGWSTLQLFPPSSWPWQSTGKAKIEVNLVLRQLTLGVGPAMRKVEPFKHLLCETAHPQFLVLKLWAPMGACLGHYGDISFKIFSWHVDRQNWLLNSTLHIHSWVKKGGMQRTTFDKPQTTWAVLWWAAHDWESHGGQDTLG